MTNLNPEELAPFKVIVSSDDLFRWAKVIAEASGTISGVALAFKKAGKPLDGLGAQEGELDEIRSEIVEKMKQAIRIAA